LWITFDAVERYTISNKGAGNRKPGDTCFCKARRGKELRVQSAECGLRISDFGLRIETEKPKLLRRRRLEPEGRNGRPFSRRTCPPRAVGTAVVRPQGAVDCSHGWSTGRCTAGGAQPVGAFVFQHIRPFRGGGCAGTCDGSVSFRRCGQLLRPAGAKRKKGVGPFSSSAFHGLRVRPQPAKTGRLRPRRSTRGYTPSPRWGEKRPRHADGERRKPA
jgi:hypothetical protein